MNIIAGRFKGRRLESVDSLSTRPTLARVKESLFCMLDGAIEGKTCLDLFAGSGALGIEAISRGAKKVVFVDSSRDALRVLNKNLRGMEEWAQVIENDFVSALAGLRGVKFDVVFLDPPYASNFAQVALEKLASLRLLNVGAIIVVESDRENCLPNASQWCIIKKQKQYGDKSITILEFKG